MLVGAAALHPPVAPAPAGAKAAETLEVLVPRLQRFDPSSADGDAVLEMVRSVEHAVRCLRGYTTVLGARMDELAAAGSAVSASDAFAIAGKMSDHNARRAARRTELAAHLPAVGDAIRNGSAAIENFDAMAAARRRLRHHDEWMARFDAMDSTLAHRARSHRPKPFAEWLTRIVGKISTDDSEAVAEQDRNSVRTWTTGEGRVRGSIDLDAQAGSEFLHALDSQSASLASRRQQAGEEFHLDQHHRALAFTELVNGVNAGYGRAAINVVIDHETLTEGPHNGTLARTTNGFDLPIDTIRRYLCDAWLTHTLLAEDGLPLKVGRTHRTATDAQRNALGSVYDSCSLCDVPFAHCQIHHLIEWEEGGLTDIDNLLPLCSHHHTQVHSGRTSVELSPDRTLRVSRGDGTVWSTIPPPSRQTATRATRTATNHLTPITRSGPLGSNHPCPTNPVHPPPHGSAK